MPKQKFEVVVDVPEGYKIKDFRPAAKGDVLVRVINGSLTAVTCSTGRIQSYYASEFIIEKVIKYRDPVLPADWGKKARFSNDGIRWVDGEIAAFASFLDHMGENPWSDRDAWHYKYCQVVDE